MLTSWTSLHLSSPMSNAPINSVLIPLQFIYPMNPSIPFIVTTFLKYLLSLFYNYIMPKMICLMEQLQLFFSMTS